MPAPWEPPVWYLDGLEMPIRGTCDFIERTQLNTVYNSDPQIIRGFASCPVVTLCFLKGTAIFEGGIYSPPHVFFITIVL